MLLNEIHGRKEDEETRIKNWLLEVPHLKEHQYTIHDDLSVSVVDSVNLSDKRLLEIPFKFREVAGAFNCRRNHLQSLKNCPEKVGQFFDCGMNQITSLEHAPKYVSGYFSCVENRITNLHHINRHIKSIKGSFECDAFVTQILGLFFIDNLRYIYMPPSATNNAQEIMTIVNRYLDHKDIHSCQEELIQAGFPKQARI